MSETFPASPSLTPGRMPTLYLSHGAPPLFDDPAWIEQLRSWSAALPRPEGIVIVSAHWESAPVSLSAVGAATPLVYDFGGFDRRFYEMTYATPDASELARKVEMAMPVDEPVHRHPRRGLDHGAWVPLKVMYPDADIPALQMSLPTHDPVRLLELGGRLQTLRDEGVLVIGSGFMTHGLPFIRDFRFDAPAPSWSAEFDAWVHDALARGDVDELARYATNAPGMPYAHPTVDHFSPLFVTLGAASDPTAPSRQVIEGFWMGMSKRSLQLS